jgi:hypothetical protein
MKKRNIIIAIVVFVGMIVVGRWLFFPAHRSTTLNASPVASIPGDSVRATIETVIQRNLKEGKTPNRLINEKSPYLLQHATYEGTNTVEEGPWQGHENPNA